VAGTRIKNGGLQNTSSGDTLGTEWIQEEAGTAKANWMDIVRRDLKDMVGATWWEWMKPKNWRQTEQNGVNV